MSPQLSARADNAVKTKDGKEPSLLGFGAVRVLWLQRFGSVSFHFSCIWVLVLFGSLKIEGSSSFRSVLFPSLMSCERKKVVLPKVLTSLYTLYSVQLRQLQELAELCSCDVLNRSQFYRRTFPFFSPCLPLSIQVWIRSSMPRATMSSEVIWSGWSTRRRPATQHCQLILRRVR